MYELDVKSKVSSYQPIGKERDILLEVLKDYTYAEQLRNTPYREFNDLSLIDRDSTSWMSFNSYIAPKSLDPDEAWRANTVRPMTRNKIMSIVSHITANILYPNVFAQNDNDEEDRDAALVMKDLMEWSGDQSNYEREFIRAVITLLVSPKVILYEGYQEIYRTIKEIQEDGKWKKKEILDEVLSGFINMIIPVRELFMSDFYEPDVQKQPFIIWRRIIDYSDAKQKYGGISNFDEYVAPGVKIFFSDTENHFYTQYDNELEQVKVEEVIYYNRLEDLELTVVNGVLLSDPDQPINRKDKKYPFAASGGEQLDEGRFFYHKSMVDKLSPIQEDIDKLYNMILDGTFMSIMPPAINYGKEQIDASVVIPGSVTTLSENSKFETLNVGTNLSAGMSTLQMLESSAAETGTDPFQMSQKKGKRTAFEIAREENQQRAAIGVISKLIGFLVKDFGELRMNTILQYLTVGDASEVLSKGEKLKFRKFLLPERISEGKKKTRKIEFTMDMPSEPITKEEHTNMQYDLLKEEGGMDSDKEIFKVNPSLFRDLKFKVIIAPDIIAPRSDSLKKALNLEAYDRAINNPLVDQEAILRDFLLENYRPGESERYIKKQQPQQNQGQQPPQPEGDVSKKLVGQMTGGGKMGLNQMEGLTKQP